MKWLSSFLLAITFVLSAHLTKAQDTASPFIDVYSDYEYLNDVDYLKEKDIVEGYEIRSLTGVETTNQFRPDYEINRAELVKIMVEAQFTDEAINKCLGGKLIKGLKTVYFSDVSIDDWFAKYVCIAKEKRLIDGYPDGTFLPGKAVNFAEAAKIIANALKLKKETVTGDEWFKPFVRALIARKGVPPSVGKFDKLITRGEMARMIHAAKESLTVPSLTLETLEELTKKAPELPQIDSCNALIEKLELDKPLPPAMKDGEMRLFLEERAPVPGPVPSEAPTAGEGGAGREEAKIAGDYSETNVQVLGVDEADIIKNDGKYIYLIRGNTVRIVQAYPGDQLKEVATIKVDDEEFTPQEMYVDADQMVIIGSVYRYRAYPEPYFLEPFTEVSIVPPSFDQTRTKIYLYNIKNRARPKKQRSIEIEGSYSSSRKVEKNVYFVMNQYIPYFYLQSNIPADIILPRFKDSARGNVEQPLVRCMNIHYFPRFERNYLIVAGLNIADLDSDISRKVLLGSSETIYASRENLYVAMPDYREVRRREGRDIFFDTEQVTLVYRFTLDQGQVKYQNQGSVPGIILNQFSMDEMGKYFRIATTRDFYNPQTGSVTDNNLYIVDKAGMTVTGKVENMAPGERIKSVRFVGSRGYVVTFRNVDPLFVIDLADPSNPKILGKLKIPGWSDYLHPYDETHLIGFGREVHVKAESAKVITPDLLMGMKLSLFDVGDVENPKELFKEVIGARGTTSELLFNHKALLFDREKKLLAFPIIITENKSKDPLDLPGNIQTVFAGGIVYSLDLTNGFKLKGKVTHYESDDIFLNAGEYFYGEFGRNIQRMIYIGEYLYSISPDFVRSYILDTVKPVSFIKLEGERQDDVYYLDK